MMEVHEPEPGRLGVVLRTASVIPAPDSRRHGVVDAMATEEQATTALAWNVGGGDHPERVDPGCVAASTPRPAPVLRHLGAVVGVPPRVVSSHGPDLVAALGAATRAPLGSGFALRTIEVTGAGAVTVVPATSTAPACGTGLGGLWCRIVSWFRSL
jgi:hypothetical protein